MPISLWPELSVGVWAVAALPRTAMRTTGSRANGLEVMVGKGNGASFWIGFRNRTTLGKTTGWESHRRVEGYRAVLRIERVPGRGTCLACRAGNLSALNGLRIPGVILAASGSAPAIQAEAGNRCGTGGQTPRGGPRLPGSRRKSASTGSEGGRNPVRTVTSRTVTTAGASTTPPTCWWR